MVKLLHKTEQMLTGDTEYTEINLATYMCAHSTWDHHKDAQNREVHCAGTCCAMHVLQLKHKYTKQQFVS